MLILITWHMRWHVYVYVDVGVVYCVSVCIFVVVVMALHIFLSYFSRKTEKSILTLISDGSPSSIYQNIWQVENGALLRNRHFLNVFFLFGDNANYLWCRRLNRLLTDIMRPAKQTLVCFLWKQKVETKYCGENSEMLHI